MKVEVGFGRRDELPENKINAILVRIEGTVQRVGFRRFVERAARRFRIVGYAENMKDGTVRILAQGDSGGLDEFLSEIKNAPRPIIVDSMVPKKVKVVPSLKHFQIKVGSMAVELQEGFGAVETQFGDYRQEFKDYRSEFRGFTAVTGENFKSLDTKYGEISSKLSQILEALEKESTETRKELTRAVDNLSRLVEEYVKRLPPRDTQ